MVTGIRRALSALVVLGLAACSSGGDNTDGALLDLNNLPTSPTRLVLSLTCPAGIAAGQTLGGFLATLADSKGQPIEGAFVGIRAEIGSISAPPDKADSGGAATTRFGEVPFTLKLAKDADVSAPILITARADYLGASVVKTCSVGSVSPNFAITAPAAGTALITSGAPQAVELSWFDDNSQGVSGNVRFTTTANGRLSAAVGGPFGTTLTASTDTTGSLVSTTPVFVSCARSGSFTLKAEEVGHVGAGAVSSVINLSCLAQPNTLSLEANPLQLKTKPDSNYKSTVTVGIFDLNGKEVPNVPITFELLTPLLDGGESLVPSGRLTDAKGLATTTYQAGTVAGTATIRACVRGTSICRMEDIYVASSGSAATNTAAIALTCPSTIVRGGRNATFVARLTSGGTGIANARIDIQPDRGAIDAPPDQPATYGGMTDSTGRLAFAYTSPNDYAGTVAIRTSTSINGTNITRSCAVNVLPDNFVLTSPINDSQQSLGADNAKPITLSWKKADGSPVASSLRISVDNGGQILTNGGSGTTQYVADTTSTGELPASPAISLMCGNGGAITLRAEDANSNQRVSVVRVQCIDPPSYVLMDFMPGTINASPSENRFTTINVQAFGTSGQSLRNTDLTLQLVGSPSANDKLYVTQGNTLYGSPVQSRFEASTATGTATIRACVKGTSVCLDKSITINR